MSLNITEKLDITEGVHIDATLTLPFELRQRSRLLARLDGGEPVGLFLSRGSVLRGGDLLRASDGRIVQVRAAREAVSTVFTPGNLLLVRAAYHLGNRHVPLQIGIGWVRYQRDHVLDIMVENLGLSVLHEDTPFEPEAGAYGGGHHHHHAAEAQTSDATPLAPPALQTAFGA
ncbi:urease accessory protein UreE [Plasticicumulans acidivorans]|uniref:Urease accessory protein UreE n=1 Tax=Plasticicumulans acidivorans TaxID=886464 RepID=A0A317MYD2_9GAMM|nr:urease accessory protein UreE [Plasticicumulans acidivorans]PWV64441.1 urease accessory protein [Plasticicumulans acidivorans]